ncbi:MAG: hypothetical protein GY792_29180, partial [Gammaproteobacteria bacterium]|nr:hypothetical protein [Gammaproteobacteria bacterium]
LSAPVWLILTADGQVMGKEPEDRQALLAPPVNSKAQNDDGQVSGNSNGAANGSGATPAAGGAASFANAGGSPVPVNGRGDDSRQPIAGPATEAHLVPVAEEALESNLLGEGV